MNGSSRTVVTAQDGSYEFIDVTAGETYIVGVTNTTHNFDPQVVNVNDTVSELDFVTPARTRCGGR
jgi:hypothetical protein